MRVLLLAAVLAGAMPPGRDGDDRPVPEPAESAWGQEAWSDGVHAMFIHQLKKPLNPLWWLRRLGALPSPRAADVDAFDEVPDSTWYVNRHALRPMSPEGIAAGPEEVPPSTGTWTVLKEKSSGINPGFVAREDAGGRLLFVKLDPRDRPGLACNGEVVVSRLLHAAGWRVPDNRLVAVDPGRLRRSPKATARTRYNAERPMTNADLAALLARAPALPDGRVLLCVSAAVPGRPKGPAAFWGLRRDDPNDDVRHEDRRSLRALRVLYAWVNNTDGRRANTLDVYVGESPRGHVRHYLLDFSASFGSGNDVPKLPDEGHEYRFDPEAVLSRAASLGVWVDAWERAPRVDVAEYGPFAAEPFDPGEWRPSFANPAFERLTAADAFWAARVVTSFRDEDIRAAVGRGYFPTPGAEERLVGILAARRDRICAWGFDVRRVAPLDDFRLEGGPGAWRLSFRDLAVERGCAPGTTRYSWRPRGGSWVETSSFALPIHGSSEEYEVRVSRGASWGRPLKLTVSWTAGRPALTGLKR